ncbi:MAG: serine hydrolase, partial [Gemmatimonadetes bacterium]|nr:serine hydrolase [Gemmatimonadota bacterium]
SAADLVKFGLALLSDRLISDSMKTEALRPMILPSGETSPFGFGFSFDVTDDGHPFAWSSGGAIGGRAGLVLFPEEGLVAAVTASASGRRFVDDAIAAAEAFRGPRSRQGISHRRQ